jgi:hypothetical protein
MNNMVSMDYSQFNSIKNSYMSSVRLLFDEKLVFKLKEVTKEVFQKTLGTDCE